MVIFVIAIGLLLISLLTIVLLKTYFYLPFKELKRQAASQDKLARMLFGAATYGAELKLLLWLVIGLSAAGAVVLLVSIAPPVLGLVVVALTIWLGLAWLPRIRLTTFDIRLAEWCTPVVVVILRLLHPLMSLVSRLLGHYAVAPHTGLFERQDVFDLIDQQKGQTDNRLSEHELDLMRRVLQFGDFRVRDVMVPRRVVKAVGVNDQIGPILMDELHASGHRHFPVYEGEPTNLVGILSLHTISDVKHHGTVRDHFDDRLVYIHEADSLPQAIRAFYETKQRLFIVVNNFKEYVGIVTVDDVLLRLIGAVPHEASRHDDRAAVAARHQPKKTMPETEGT